MYIVINHECSTISISLFSMRMGNKTVQKISVKNDRKDNKLRWELLPLEDIEDLVKVYTKGAEKYGDNNWQNLEDGYRRYKAAAFRHILEYERGNEFDSETGCRHLAQAAWNLLACLHISKQNNELPSKGV